MGGQQRGEKGCLCKNKAKVSTQFRGNDFFQNQLSVEAMRIDSFER